MTAMTDDQDVQQQAHEAEQQPVKVDPAPPTDAIILKSSD
jgi:hypothetical protein